jgi:hypothetical protein
VWELKKRNYELEGANRDFSELGRSDVVDKEGRLLRWRSAVDTIKNFMSISKISIKSIINCCH